MQLPDVHLCIVQPAGYVHSLGLVDPARFFRHQFRRMGARVTLAKNRLRHDAVNLVFGAHLGFPSELRQRHSCVFVNLEQLGDGGAAVSPAYLQLLRGSAVIDYDAGNVGAYTANADDVPIVSFAHAPYLDAAAMPISERPIELLFFGSLNDRRRRLIAAIEAAGVQVSLPDAALYGPERDALIVQARAVLNCHFYDSARFEQVRAFHCLSLGTPVISERGAGANPPPQFESGVCWVDAARFGEEVARRLRAPGFAERARGQLDAFAAFEVVDQYADALAFAAGYRQEHARRIDPAPWRPTRMNIGSGKDYRAGWLNVDILPAAQPDLVLDLSREIELPATMHSTQVGPVRLEPGSLELIHASNVLEHVPDLPRLMGNCLALLREGGQMWIEVPHERAPTAWQDPTHVRAMNARSWIYYSDWFWYLGWFDWRFHVAQLGYLDGQLRECAEADAQFMRVTLVKVATTLAERTTARTMQAGFGGLDDDLPADERDDVRALPVAAAL